MTINIYYLPSRSLYSYSLASKNDFSSSSNSLFCISGSDMESIIIQLSWYKHNYLNSNKTLLPWPVLLDSEPCSFVDNGTPLSSALDSDIAIVHNYLHLSFAYMLNINLYLHTTIDNYLHMIITDCGIINNTVTLELYILLSTCGVL